MCLSVVINERLERFIVFNIANLFLLFSALDNPSDLEISEKKKRKKNSNLGTVFMEKKSFQGSLPPAPQKKISEYTRPAH